MASSGRSCRTFTNRDPTGVGHRVSNRTLPSPVLPPLGSPPTGKESSDAPIGQQRCGAGTGPLKPPAAGRTNGGSKGTIILNVGEDLIGDSVGVHGMNQGIADRTGGHSFNEAGTHTESRVVVDAGDGVELRPVSKMDAADHVHLPQLHGARTFPSLVIGPGALLLLRFDQPVSYERLSR